MNEPIKNLLPPANSSSIVQMDPLVAMIERAARDPSIDMDRLERLLEMKERAELRQAASDFNEAMAKVQGEITPIARDANNPQTRSKYASYFAVDKAIRPIYVKYGFRVSFNEELQAGDNVIRVIAIVTRGMHREEYHYDSPIVTTGIAGKAIMTLTHARASAVTYAKRYLMGMIWNLSTGEDTDGNVVDVELIDADDVAELQAHIKVTGTDEKALCSYFKIASIAQMPLKDLARAKEALAKKAALAKAQAAKPQEGPSL